MHAALIASLSLIGLILFAGMPLFWAFSQDQGEPENLLFKKVGNVVGKVWVGLFVVIACVGFWAAVYREVSAL